jgi:hypothetical protein
MRVLLAAALALIVSGAAAGRIDGCRASGGRALNLRLERVDG